MELLQKQEQKLSQQQIQSAQLLQMSTLELEAYVRELSLENPMVEPEEAQGSAPPEPERDELLGRLRWLEDNDRQNLFYQHVVPEELDPLARAATEGGLEETLLRFLSRQLYRMELDEDTAQTVRYLASCLDDSGYFRIPLEELSRDTGVSAPRLERALDILQSLEPAGVGARDLSECLALQLRRIRETGPALDIVRDHLELLAARRYQAIAGKLGVPVEEVPGRGHHPGAGPQAGGHFPAPGADRLPAARRICGGGRRGSDCAGPAGGAAALPHQRGVPQAAGAVGGSGGQGVSHGQAAPGRAGAVGRGPAGEHRAALRPGGGGLSAGVFPQRPRGASSAADGRRGRGAGTA